MYRPMYRSNPKIGVYNMNLVKLYHLELQYDKSILLCLQYAPLLLNHRWQHNPILWYQSFYHDYATLLLLLSKNFYRVLRKWLPVMYVQYIRQKIKRRKKQFFTDFISCYTFFHAICTYTSSHTFAVVSSLKCGYTCTVLVVRF